jgi:tRNA(fMet)-specific endonuclease VapC
MSQRYLLDTNVVSHIMQGRDADLLARLAATTVGQVAMSSVTLAGIEYELQRRGQPVRYGALCTKLETEGLNLSDMDMMIAANAVAAVATLVSHDKAFAQVTARGTLGFKLEIW